MAHFATRGKPLEFLDETYLAKNKGMRLPYGKKFVILTSTVFDWSTRVTDGRTDRQRDGRAIGRQWTEWGWRNEEGSWFHR